MTRVGGAIEIVEVRTPEQQDAFIGVPHLIYADDPTWVAPLTSGP